MTDETREHSEPAETGGEHEHEHAGGHEVDAMPNRRMFNLLFGLSLITLLCCIGLIQVFNRQAESISAARAKGGSFQLEAYRAEMKRRRTQYGPGAGEGEYRIPLRKAKELALEQPARFQAFPPPEGWMHPDDLASGSAAGEGEAAEGEAAEGEAAEGEAAEGEAADTAEDEAPAQGGDDGGGAAPSEQREPTAPAQKPEGEQKSDGSGKQAPREQPSKQAPREQPSKQAPSKPAEEQGEKPSPTTPTPDGN